MPASFKTSGIYKKQPDALAYIREEGVRGTVAFYERWQGVQIVCNIRGLKKGSAFIGMDKENNTPLSVDERGVLTAKLFEQSLNLAKIKGRRPFIENNGVALMCGKIK